MITAAIVGASGYSGAELLRLLHTRTDVSLTKLVAASSAGKRVSEVYPWFTSKVDTVFQPLDAASLPFRKAGLMQIEVEALRQDHFEPPWQACDPTMFFQIICSIRS